MQVNTISVIIPCFNAEPWIRETLQSVIEQGFEDIEVIVVDDGSTDSSAGIIEREFPFVHLIRTKNQGPSKARNLGTQQSKGEFIQYLDADDLLGPGKLKLQLEILQDSRADVAYGGWQRLVKVKDGIFEKSEEVNRRLKNPVIDLFTDFWCPPAVYLFRRSIVERVGGWNERLPIIQDARFALDCALRGGRFVYCSGIMGFYRDQSFGSVSSRDSVGFVRDCLTNAVEVENWWERHGGVDEERTKALLQVYGYVARASFERDKRTFESAYQALERLQPGFIPPAPRHLNLASRLLGYRKAEVLALWYRRIKGAFSNRQNILIK